MIVVALDTSGDLGTVGLVIDNKTVGEVLLEMGRTALSRLIPTIDFLIKSCEVQIQDVDLFVVGLGPGSWSGLRIGVTTVKSLAHVLDKPIVGVSSLEAIANNFRHSSANIYAVIDAQRNHVYYSGFRVRGERLERFTDHNVVSVDAFVESIEKPAVVAGDAMVKYHALVQARLGDGVSIESTHLSHVRGGTLAELGLQRYLLLGKDDTFSLVPMYLQSASSDR